jgi:two-component sensor histidine kinase
LTSNAANLFTVGTRAAWLFAVLALIAVYFLSGETIAWHIWMARLLLSYCLALLLANQMDDTFSLTGKLVASIVMAFLAALITEAGFNIFVRVGYPVHLGNGLDLLLSTIFSSYLLISTILSDAARGQIKSEKQIVELKLNALQAQIEPHFLYNTLANVQELIRVSPANAERMVAHLVVYLKATIPDVRKGHTLLGQEVDRAQAYLQIMQIRMGERLAFKIEVADDLRQISVPPLSLMTLVENAVQHGIDKLPEGGKVVIIAAMQDKKLTVQVIDNGAGFDDNIGSGMGLINLRERLATAYGACAFLDLTQVSPQGVEAKLTLPSLG